VETVMEQAGYGDKQKYGKNKKKSYQESAGFG
jgi:hypothetical protein